MLISHPKKSLYDHLNNTYKIGFKIFMEKRLCFKAFSPDVLENIVKISLLAHDFGKAMSYFQEYMTDIENGCGKIRHDRSEIKNHGLISGVLAFVLAKSIIKDDVAAFLVYMVVSKHHGNHDNLPNYASDLNEEKRELLIRQFESIDMKELQDLATKLKMNFDFKEYNKDKFVKDLDSISPRIMMKFEKRLSGLEGYMLLNLVFSILIFSDKLEAIFYSEETPLDVYMEGLSQRVEIADNLVEEYKNNFCVKETVTAEIREAIYQDVVDSVRNLDLSKKILSINLPTGAGKTLTALKSSLILKQRLEQNGMHPRIIYLLPFTSVIEQNYKVISKVFGTDDSNVLLKHHHLSERVFKDDDGVLYEGSIGEHLIETWESEFIISTFVQFLHSVLSNKNRQLKKFHNIANSIVILDEVQSIPHKYWGLIKEVLKYMGEALNCYFILMTATMPLIFDEEEGEIFELAKGKREYFKKFNRIDIDTSLIKNRMNLTDFKEHLSNDILKFSDKSFLIVMNTIKSSVDVYRYLEKEFGEDATVLYLSTNIIPKHRLARINCIKNNPGRKIIVSTQMIEAGVDIDIDRVYRDLGPMDSINQTAGRCNREGGKEKGQVILVSLVDGNNRDADYYKYIYDKILMECTKGAIGEIEKIPESDIFKYAKEYFSRLQKYGSDNEGEEILKLLYKLECKNAFEYKEDSKNKVFRLIPNTFETVDIFVEVDENAKKVWDRLIEAKSVKNRFERKTAINKLKKDINNYTISVPEKVLKRHLTPEENELTKITSEMLFNVYDLKTGFIRDQFEDYIF